MMKRSLLAAIALAWIVPAALGALEVSDGRIKLALNEANGRFSLYFMTDMGKGTFTPLFLDQDPRTSVATLVADGKGYRLGEDPVFTLSAAKVEGGAQFQFRSSFALVTQKFTLIRSKSSSFFDGVSISYLIENLSDKEMTMGLRVLIDTSLGEGSGAHFKTSLKPKIALETQLDGDYKDAYWVSPGGSCSLESMLSGEGVTRPDSVVFANWKRINDAAWSFDVNATRNFNLLPYSINDSAVAQYYDAKTLPKAGVRTIVLVLGNFAEGGFSSPATASAVASSSDLAPAPSSGSAPAPAAPAVDPVKLAGVETDLAAIKKLLAELDKKLASGLILTDLEYDTYMKLLEQLASRKSGY